MEEDKDQAQEAEPSMSVIKALVAVDEVLGDLDVEDTKRVMLAYAALYEIDLKT